jgi:hypothetical protein
MTLYGLEFSPELCGGGECCCDELIVNGKRVPPPPGHSCEYVRARSVLVPQAVKIANDCGTDDPYVWTRAFVAAMDELSAPLLNGSNVWRHCVCYGEVVAG